MPNELSMQYAGATSGQQVKIDDDTRGGPKANSDSSGDVVGRGKDRRKKRNVPPFSPASIDGPFMRQESDQTIVREATDDGDDDRVRQLWMDSDFAVGQTKPTWADDDVGCAALCRSVCSGCEGTHLHCTAFVCSRIGAGRVGNLVVLWQRMEDVQSAEGAVRKPRLICVLGPFWATCTFVTVPFLLAFSVSVFFWRIATYPCAKVVITWGLLHVGLLISLVLASCRDPGVLYRHREPPIGEQGQSWTWNSQAHTFRPPSARYDPECAVVIEEFHHTCPWIGTAVGRRNHCYFTMFLIFTVLILFYNVFLLLFHDFPSLDDPVQLAP